MAYLLVTQPRHKCQLCSLARWSYQHSYANGKSHWLGLVSFLIPATAIKNMICQDSSTGCFEPCPLLHFYPILRGLTPLIPQVIPVRRDPSCPPGKHPPMLGKLDVHLGLSFSHWRNWNFKFQRGPLGIVLCQPWEGVLQSKWNHLFYPSNVVLFGLCIQGSAFSLTFRFWDFHKGVLYMDSCQLVFLEGEVKSGTTYSAILLTF